MSEAQRLADELDTGDFDVMTNYQAADLLRRQEAFIERQRELLRQALEAMVRGTPAEYEAVIATIRAHQEAK